MLNPMRDKNEGTCPGGEGATPVTHGLSRRLLRVKPPTSCAAKQKWWLKNKNYLFCA